MSVIGNIIWFIFGGFILGICYILLGVLFCITVIGIPFGLQIVKIGVLAMCPFGRDVQLNDSPMSCINLLLNIVWILIGGLELAIAHLIIGLFFFITIIGIPFGMQHVKLAKLALLPFSQTIN